MQAPYYPQQTTTICNNPLHPLQYNPSIAPTPVQPLQPVSQQFPGSANAIPQGFPCPVTGTPIMTGNSNTTQDFISQRVDIKKCRHCHFKWNSVTIKRMKKKDVIIGSFLGLLLIIPGVAYCCCTSVQIDCCANCRKCDTEDEFCCDCTNC